MFRVTVGVRGQGSGVESGSSVKDQRSKIKVRSQGLQSKIRVRSQGLQGQRTGKRPDADQGQEYESGVRVGIRNQH